MKTFGKDNIKNLDTYHQLVNKITQITKNDNLTDNQNRNTLSNNNFMNKDKNVINQYNQRNNQVNDIKQKQRLIYEKMNQKLSNNRRNVDWGDNVQNSNNIFNNGEGYINRNEIDQNKIFIDNRKEYSFGGGKNAPIVKVLNERNNQSHTQNLNSTTPNYYNNHFSPYNNNSSESIINIVENKNTNPNTNTKTNTNKNININYSFKNNYENNNNNQNDNYNYQIKSNDNNIKNDYPKFPENSINYRNNPNNNNNINNNNSNQNILFFNSSEEVNNESPKKNSQLCSSLLYGLIFGSLGTLLLWLKNPSVREYLKSCYNNINSESILNFFKSFLNPIELFKSLGTNSSSFKDILLESLNYIYQFIEDYSDLWRLLGVIAMVFVLWIIIKKIIKMLKKSKKKKKNINNNDIQI